MRSLGALRLVVVAVFLIGGTACADDDDDTAGGFGTYERTFDDAGTRPEESYSLRLSIPEVGDANLTVAIDLLREALDAPPLTYARLSCLNNTDHRYHVVQGDLRVVVNDGQRVEFKTITDMLHASENWEDLRSAPGAEIEKNPLASILLQEGYGLFTQQLELCPPYGASNMLLATEAEIDSIERVISVEQEEGGVEWRKIAEQPERY